MSYKIFYAKGYESGTIGSYDDPLVLDVRPKQDNKLRGDFGTDYRHVEELSNKGINVTILKNEEQGRIRLKAALKRCQEFERELVIVYDDADHMKKIKEIIDEFKHGNNAL